MNIVKLIEKLQAVRVEHGNDVEVWHLHDWTEPITEVQYCAKHLNTVTGDTLPKRVELSGS